MGYRAGLARGLGEDGDVVLARVRLRAGEGEPAIGRDREVVRTVVLQHHAPGQPRDRPADGEAVGETPDPDVRNACTARRTGAVGDGTDLCARLSADRDVETTAIRDSG